MARIRTIKPEFWVSEQVAECSTNARLLFLGLLNFCDDAGRHPASCKRLKMEVFPSDNFNTDEIAGWISELIENGLVGEYSAQGSMYWYVTGWNKHQKVDRPSVKYPGPFDEYSTIVRGTLSEDSTTIRRGLALESNGMESNGVERKGKEDSCSEPATQTSEPPVPAKPVLIFPTVGTGAASWKLSLEQLAEWKIQFPGIAVECECRKALAWCNANATKRKTAKGMPAFLVRWLSKAQDNGGNRKPHKQIQVQQADDDDDLPDVTNYRGAKA